MMIKKYMRKINKLRRVSLYNASQFNKKVYYRYLDNLTKSRKYNHGLDRDLIISLTSYPARFHTLDLTLHSLIRQNVQPDKIVLWIAQDDMNLLPKRLWAFRDFGVIIKPTRDIKSYKKLIPSLVDYPESYIVTADDDLFYPKDWLRSLVDRITSNMGKTVLSCRAHLVIRNNDGLPKQYEDWDFDIRGPIKSKLVFPTTGAGVLYKPGIFDKRVFDADSFLRLSPTADDIWFYMMALLNGAQFEKIDYQFRVLPWKNSQAEALSSINTNIDKKKTAGIPIEESMNTVQMKNIIGKYGFPVD